MMRLTCRLIGHEWMHPRPYGTTRGALEMECARCGAVHRAEVDLTPHWPLLARMRRQVPWARARSRTRAR